MENIDRNVENDNHNKESKKTIKQFVIVKEYNGSFYPQKKTKREYTQKTILKERLSKSERNSLEFLDRLNTPTPTPTATALSETKKDSCKYVTLIDLPSLDDNNDDTVETPKKKTKTYETFQKGAIVSLLAVGGLFGAYTILKNNGE